MNNLRCEFVFPSLDGDQYDEMTPPVMFIVELDDKVAKKLRTENFEYGYFHERLKCTLEPYHEGWGIRIDIYGDINPGYSDEVLCLFGDEVGNILLRTGDIYDEAKQRNVELAAAGRASEVGSLTLLRELLEVRESPALAVHVHKTLVAAAESVSV